MKSSNGLNNQLKAVRTRLGLSQQELAATAGVTRQTVSGIEAGLYAPSAAVALRLARTLGCPVEELFWIEGDFPTVQATSIASATPIQHSAQSLRVALSQIGGRWVARPLLADTAFRHEMIPADGLATATQGKDTLMVQLLDDAQKLARTVVVGGCAPALSLWTRSAERWYPGLRVHWAHANSTAALQSLARGELHIAGIHLHDPVTGDDNLSFVKKIIPKRPVVLINFGVWEEGLIVQEGNPKQLSKAADLTRKKITIVNREVGAGARFLLDVLLSEESIAPAVLKGYNHEVHSHQEVAQAVLTGQADVGVSTAAVATAYGLSFVPLRQVRYDLVVLEEYFQQEPVQQLLGTLDHRWVRSQLHVLGGYDTSRTGEIMTRN
ncbi:MAG: helix-turn-helix domain-containing protein [Abitibacteriaceae bacterium]|nr:helix-turn-helix domain-containing protein [Abditibacteriaceae bacterium]